MDLVEKKPLLSGRQRRFLSWLPLLDSNQRSSLQNGRLSPSRSKSSLLLSALRLPPPPAAVGFPSPRFFLLSSSLQNGRSARFRSHFSLLLSALRLPPPPAAVGFPSPRFFLLSSSLQNGRSARFRSHFSLLLSALRLPPSATGGGRLRAHRGTAVSLVSLPLSQKTSCVFCETRRSKAACGWFCFS